MAIEDLLNQIKLEYQRVINDKDDLYLELAEAQNEIKRLQDLLDQQPQDDPVPVPEANITLEGLASVVSGLIYVEAKVDQPVDSVRFELPGVVDRTERSAPYALMSDAGFGKINPLDTTTLANKSYVLTVTATLKSASVVKKTFSFTVKNDAPAPTPTPTPDPVPAPSPSDAPTGISLPTAIVGWSVVPTKFRPPSPDAIAEVISTSDSKLMEKLKTETAGKWRVVRGSKFPAGSFDFKGWVKLECDFNPDWANIPVRGTSNDDRLWFENVKLTSVGCETMMAGVEFVYCDRVIMENFGDFIVDTTNWAKLSGAVINTEMRKIRKDCFKAFQGAAINVSFSSFSGGDSHPDMLQFDPGSTGNGIYWKDVYCGGPKNPVAIMSIRGDIINSMFINVRHYRVESMGYASVDLGNGSGTVFDGCYLPFVYHDGGSKVINSLSKAQAGL